MSGYRRRSRTAPVVRRWREISLWFLCQALFGLAPAAAQDAPRVLLGMEEAVDVALERNPQAIISAAAVDEARGGVEVAQSRVLPTVDFAYDYGRNLQRPAIFFNQGGQTQQITVGEAHDNTFSVTVRQTLFDPSLPSALSAASEARALAAAADEEVRRLVALDVRAAYLEVLLHEQLVLVREQALEQADARLTEVRQRSRVGLSSEFDSLTALVARENQRPPLIDARLALEQSRDRLKGVLALPLATELVLTDSLTHPALMPSTPETADSLVTARPDVRAARQEVALREAALVTEERGALPTIDLSAGLQRRASSQDVVPANQDFVQSFVLGAHFSWSLFDGREGSGRTLQARAQLRRAEARLQQVVVDARLDLETTQQELLGAQTLVEAAQATIAQAERALEIGRTRFTAGLSTQLELGEAELQLTQARTNLAQALFRSNLALVRWNSARGTPR
jgi:outer membrane protein